MPRPKSYEEHRRAGLHVSFRRLDVVGAPNIDMGVFENPPTANATQETYEGYDERGGARVLDEYDVTQSKREWTFQTRNLDPEILALFYMAAAPGEFDQAATAVVDRAYTAKKGRHLLLTDVNGNRVFNVGSVVVEDAGDTPFTVNTDYIVDAVKGWIFIPTDSTIDEDEALKISYTPAVMTDRPQILPETALVGVTVEAEVWYVSAAGQRQVVRRIPRMRITSAGEQQLGVGQSNTITIRGVELVDPLAAVPAGDVLDVK